MFVDRVISGFDIIIVYELTCLAGTSKRNDLVCLKAPEPTVMWL